MPADLQAALATLGPKWGLQQLVDIDDEQARDDLARLSAATLSIVAQAARGRQPAVPESEVEQGENAAAQFLIRWRGEADPRHVKALDTYWVSAAEHGLNASTFTARIAASTGADCAAAMSSAVGTLSGPLHGGAPARVLPMLDDAEQAGDPEQYVRDLLDRGERIMGFGHRVYRAEDPRARVLKRTALELGSPKVEVAEALEEAALTALREKSPDRLLETNVEYWAAVVLDIAEHSGRPDPAMFGCARVAGWSAHILEQKRTGRLIRPVGPVHRPRAAPSVRRLAVTLADAAAQADALAEEGKERELAQLRSEWDEELEASARGADFRERAVAYRAIGQFRFRTKIELLRRGLEDESPAVRGSALLSLERLSRDHPGDVNDVRPLLHELVTHDGNEAVRRLAVVALEERLAAARHDPDPHLARRRRRAASRAARRRGEGRAGAAPQDAK